MFAFLTPDIQTGSLPDFALPVQHGKAPLVHHPDRVQRQSFLRHAEASYVFFCWHGCLVVQDHRWRLCCMVYLSLIGLNLDGPVINMTSCWIQATEFVLVCLCRADTDRTWTPQWWGLQHGWDGCCKFLHTSPLAPKHSLNDRTGNEGEG